MPSAKGPLHWKRIGIEYRVKISVLELKPEVLKLLGIL